MKKLRALLPSGQEVYVIAGLVILPIGFAVAAWFIRPVALWLDSWSQALTGYFSMVLSVGLVYLYYQQKEVLESQNHPLVSIEELKPTNSDNLDYFQARLSNIGGGPVTDLSLKIEPEIMSRGTVKSHFPLDEDEAQEFVRTELLYPTSAILDRTQSEESDISLFNSQLEAGETYLFKCPATLLLRHPIMDPGEGKENATNYSWNSAIEILEKLGVKDLRLRIWVQYDGVNEENEEFATDFVIPIDSDSSFIDHFELGLPFHRYELIPNTLHSEID